jgi:hypothetical protein
MISMPPKIPAAHSRLSTRINIHFVSMEPETIEIQQRAGNHPPVSHANPLINPSFFPLSGMAAIINRQNALSAAKIALPVTERSITEHRESPSETMTRLLQPFTTNEKAGAKNSDQNKVQCTSGRTDPPLKPVEPKSSKPAQPGLKPAEFNLEAPWAKSVKLAADFTEWQKYPLDMIKTEKGVWSLIVWLAPGKYSYRFIVDDQWYDDPCSVQRTTNPFGTTNTVIHVH